LEHLLFAAYLIFFAWLVTKIKFFKQSGLSFSQLIILFLLKVMAGIFYGWVGVYYGEHAQMVDTWAFYYESLNQYKELFKNPHQFFTDIFQNNYETGYGGFLSSRNSWWNDIRGNLIIKLMALFNVLSFGNYYINVIFYSFITMFGPVAIYKVMQDVFPIKRLEVLIATFLIPSFLYWTSGIHKDGIIFIGFTSLIYTVYFSLKRKRFTLLGALNILLGLAIIIGLRNYLLILITPAIIAWIVAEKSRWKPIYVFGGLYAVFILLFFTLRYVSPSLDFPASVAEKQEDFSKLTGGSFVNTKQLQPNFLSFIENTPQALTLSVLRPYPSDVRHLLSLAAAVEINFFLLLFIFFLFWRTNGVSLTPFLIFCILFAFSGLLTIGYTVNFLGAIVRYRSIFLPFLIIPMIAKIDWKRIGSLFIGNINNKNHV
jgi:hypothetical protein